jgi:hypothetical protein
MCVKGPTADAMDAPQELFNLPTKCVFTLCPEEINMILELQLENIFFVYCILF